MLNWRVLKEGDWIWTWGTSRSRHDKRHRELNNPSSVGEERRLNLNFGTVCQTGVSRRHSNRPRCLPLQDRKIKPPTTTKWSTSPSTYTELEVLNLCSYRILIKSYFDRTRRTCMCYFSALSGLVSIGRSRLLTLARRLQGQDVQEAHVRPVILCKN